MDMNRYDFPGVSISTPVIDSLESSLENAVNRIVDRADDEALPKNLAAITDVDSLLNARCGQNFQKYLEDYLQRNCIRLGLPPAVDNAALINALEELDPEPNWEGYLQGKIPRKRDNILQLGFVLKMGYKDVLEMLMLCGKEPLSARNALDFICLFCLRSDMPEQYTWEDVQEIYARFSESRGQIPKDVPAAPSADTRQLVDGMSKIIAQAANQKSELLTYMTENAASFYTFRQENRHGIGTKRYTDFLQLNLAYTKSRAAGFQRLADYLRILYDADESPRIDSFEQVFSQCFLHMNWARLNSHAVIGGQPLPLSTKSHIRAVDRFYKSIKQPDFVHQDDHGNVDFFRRNDALLMIFFLLYGFCRLHMKDTDFFFRFKAADIAARKNILEDTLASGKEPVDKFVNYAYLALGKAFSGLPVSYHTDPLQRERLLPYLMSCFDRLLRVLGYHGLYPCALPDRFCLLCTVCPDLIAAVPAAAEVLFLDMDGKCDSQAAVMTIRAILLADKRPPISVQAAGLDAQPGKVLYRAKRDLLREDMENSLRTRFEDSYCDSYLPYFTGAVRMYVPFISGYSKIVCMDEDVKTQLEAKLTAYLESAHPDSWRHRLEAEMNKCTVFSKKPENVYAVQKYSRSTLLGTWITEGCMELLKQLA